NPVENIDPTGYVAVSIKEATDDLIFALAWGNVGAARKAAKRFSLESWAPTGTTLLTWPSVKTALNNAWFVSAPGTDDAREHSGLLFMAKDGPKMVTEDVPLPPLDWFGGNNADGLPPCRFAGPFPNP